MTDSTQRSLTASELLSSRFLSAENFHADESVGPADAPSRIGKYAVSGEIARGGMGVVYLAHDPDLDRSVAIKRLVGAFSAEALERFLREGRSTAKLRHPNVVTTHHVDHDADGPYLVMELIEGESLGRRIARGGALEPTEGARLIQKIAQALDYAHREGVLHRDVKPDNVLVERDGEPVLADFGLAKPLDETQGPTVTGQVLGSPAYMSPEQVRGAKVDARADVYGLGATLYEVLTARPPIQGTSLLTTIAAVPTQVPAAPSQLCPGVPPDLDTICLKCLEKERTSRYPTAAALAEDLRLFLAGEAIHARPVSARERAWRWARGRTGLLPLAIAGVLALVGVSASVSAWQAARVLEADQLLASARELVGAGAREAALRKTEEALELQSTQGVRLRAARIYVALGRTAEARVLLEGAVAAFSPAYEELNLLHTIELLDDPPTSGDFRITAPLRRLLATAEARGDVTPHSEWLRGKLALSSERYVEAIDRFSRSIELGFAFAQLDRGVAYEELGQIDDARADFAAAHALDPRHLWPPFNLGVLEFKQGRMRQALEYLSRCVALDDRFAPALAQRGLVRLSLKDSAGALEDFDAVLTLDLVGERFPGAVATAQRGKRALAEGAVGLAADEGPHVPGALPPAPDTTHVGDPR